MKIKYLLLIALFLIGMNVFSQAKPTYKNVGSPDNEGYTIVKEKGIFGLFHRTLQWLNAAVNGVLLIPKAKKQFPHNTNILFLMKVLRR